MTNTRLFRIFSLAMLAACIAWLLWKRPWETALISNRAPVSRKIVINEAVRTLLYIPLYHAKEKGYFKDAALDVEIVTGGTATAAFAALISGEADFAVADPMYVPIAQQKGGDTRVIAQIVARIAVWGVAKDGTMKANDSTALRGRKIATHQRPMTAYTYTVKTLKDAGLDPDTDVTLITGAPGSEFAAFNSGEADVMFSLEPNTSKAILNGAKLIRSFPADLGDQVFTALMTRSDVLSQKREAAKVLVNGLQRAMDDLQASPESVLLTAKAYFPQVDDLLLKAAVKHLVEDQVIPKSVAITPESWSKAIKVRLEAGDLQRAYSVEESCDFTLQDKP